MSLESGIFPNKLKIASVIPLLKAGDPANISNYPAGTRRPRDVPWRSPKGPNVRDLKGTFRRLLEDQQKNWWFDEKIVF